VSGYIVSPEADTDIFDIWVYLTEQAGTEVANRVEEAIYAAFQQIARTPGQGHKRSDLTSNPVLFFKVFSYLIVYHGARPVEIVRVLHGKRDIQQLLPS
jgi:plasmid stabilization system protein ParE